MAFLLSPPRLWEQLSLILEVSQLVSYMYMYMHIAPGIVFFLSYTYVHVFVVELSTNIQI